MRYLFCVLLILAQMGCSYSDGRIPTFEDSNANLIRKSVESIALVDAVSAYVDREDKVIFVSMENDKTVDFSIPALIEDVMLKQLTDRGYRVLERDDNLLYRLIAESGDKYTHRERLKSVYQERSYGAQSVAVPGSLIGSYATGSQSSEALNNEYRDIGPLETSLESADKILSYRILESGIIYENQCVFTECDSIKRIADTILLVRAIDAKTGELLSMSELRGMKSDIIHVDEKLDLENYHLRFYQFGYPVIYGNPLQKEYGKAKEEKIRVNHSGSKVLGILMGIAATGGIIYILANK